MLLAAVAMAAAPPAGAVAEDWPMWGRDRSRNMVSPARGLPSSFAIGELDPNTEKFNFTEARNLKWAARLGSQSYGNPTIAAGRILLGTNNDPPKDPARTGDYGVVLCLDQASGGFLWQLLSPKLATGDASDFQQVGNCSSPTVDGNHVYLVTNRCEVICLDINGLADGNDGPFTDEAQYIAGPGRAPVELRPTDADIIWVYDMRDELGVFPHQMTSSAVLVVGDRVYATTSNGRDWTGIHMPSPRSPALICLDKHTGKLLAQERSGISERTFLCNWSSPAYGVVNGQAMVFFGADDGFCYAFDPEPRVGEDGVGVLREIWRCDANPPQYRVADGQTLRYGQPSGPSGILATPVFHDGRVYVVIGQNPEHGDGVGALTCIDADGQGDITSTGVRWRFTGLGRSMSTPSVVGGLVFVADFQGMVYCIDAATGQELWKHDTEGRIWGSTLVADGKVYVGNESGLVTVLAAARQKKLLAQIDVMAPALATPVVADGVLYIGTERYLYAVAEGARPREGDR